MKKQERVPICTPEEFVQTAEALAAMAGGRKQTWKHPLPRWVQNGLWALGGAGAMGLLWLMV